MAPRLNKKAMLDLLGELLNDIAVEWIWMYSIKPQLKYYPVLMIKLTMLFYK